jgi:hypothetical protein
MGKNKSSTNLSTNNSATNSRVELLGNFFWQIHESRKMEDLITKSAARPLSLPHLSFSLSLTALYSIYLRTAIHTVIVVGSFVCLLWWRQGLYYCRETSREGKREILAAIVHSHLLEFSLSLDKQDYVTTHLARKSGRRREMKRNCDWSCKPNRWM